jgi:hypothetical protein
LSALLIEEILSHSPENIDRFIELQALLLLYNLAPPQEEETLQPSLLSPPERVTPIMAYASLPPFPLVVKKQTVGQTKSFVPDFSVADS